jgi:hypothetical protein
MTKVEAEKYFVNHILPNISKSDVPAKREAWGVYIDSLCKSGKITQTQYETWDTPAQCNRRY